MQILEYKKLPDGLRAELETVFQDFNVEIIITYGPLNGKLGIFDPDNNRIIIDLESALYNTRWLDMGMLYVPAVFCNVLYTIYHEAAHLWQFDENPKAFQKNAPESEKDHLEKQADKEAIQSMIDFFNTMEIRPRIEDMGYLRDSISHMLNMIYSKNPTLVDMEIDTGASDAGVSADVAVAHLPLFEQLERRTLLLDHIDKGDVGLNINGRRYLQMNAFFEGLNP
jgi:hypothetical protein